MSHLHIWGAQTVLWPAREWSHPQERLQAWMVRHISLSHGDSVDRYCHQVTYRCGVAAPEVSHNWEGIVLISHIKVNKASHVCSSLRITVSHMWVGDLAIEKLDLGLHLVVCAHPLKQCCRRCYSPHHPLEKIAQWVRGRGGTAHFLREIMLLSATATLWKTSRRTVSSLQKGKTPISLSGDRGWHIPCRLTGSTWYAFVPVDNRACHRGELSYPWACNGLS